MGSVETRPRRGHLGVTTVRQNEYIIHQHFSNTTFRLLLVDVLDDF